MCLFQYPTQDPTYDPTDAPSPDPTEAPTFVPTDIPSYEPTPNPTEYKPIKSSDPGRIRIPAIHGLSFKPRLVGEGEDIRTVHQFRHDRHIDVDPNRVWLQRYVNFVLGDRS